MLLRNNSSFINILANGAKSIHQNKGKEHKKTEIIQKDSIPERMYVTLKKYKEKYQDSFYCLSIMDNEIANQEMEEFCSKNNTNFEYKDIKIKDNMLHGAGHLSEKGNEELSKKLLNMSNEKI